MLAKRGKKPYYNAMNFVYACDDHYAPHAGVSITSLFENNKELDEITVYVLVNGVSQSNEEKFTEFAEEYGRKIALIDASEIGKYLNDINILPFRTAGRETYFRLFCDRVLPEHVKRVVYLDCDIIVLGSLQELDNIQFDDNTCCAMTTSSVFKHFKQYVELKEKDNYYQAGVCIFDIDRWKLFGAKRVSELFRQGITYMRMHDMDILNIAVYQNTITLPIEYNVMADWYDYDVDAIFKRYRIDESTFYSKDAVSDAIKNTKILHFCGFKSRNAGNRMPKCELWEMYKTISPWRDILKAEFREGFFAKAAMSIRWLLPWGLSDNIIETTHKVYLKRYYAKHDHFRKLAAYREAIRKMEEDI